MSEPTIEERIHAAALELFNERGYGAATVDEIARKAGVGVGTLYRRWPDKPALANDLYTLVLDRATEYRERSRPGRSRKSRFEALVRSFIDFANEEPQMLLFLVGQPHHAYLDATNRRRQDAKDGEVLELVADLELTATPELASCMTLGTIAHCVRAGVPIDGADLCRRLWRALAR